MFLHILLIFVLQICYCSAKCVCDGIAFPVYAIILISITIVALFFSTVVLATILFRQRQKTGSEVAIFGNNKHASISKYERQVSGHSQREFANADHLDIEENSDDYIIEVDASNLKPIELEKKVRKQPKVPVFPQMQEEQMNAICKAVLLKHRMKESTSLSDLDKIVNDAKEEEKRENCKIFDLSASTPELDVYDVLPSPLPIKKLPAFKPDSVESKLQEEMKAKFSKTYAKMKVSEEDIKFNFDGDNLKPQHTEDKIKAESNNEKLPTVSNNSQPQNMEKEKTNSDEIRTQCCKDNFRLITDLDETSIQLSKGTGSDDDLDMHDKINDCPPPIRSQNDIQLSPKLCDEILNSTYHQIITQCSKDDVEVTADLNETCTQLNKETESDDDLAIQDEIYDCPPPPRPQNDIPLSQKQCDEIYETPKSKKRNVIVSDGNTTGYLIPISDCDDKEDEPQYTNAKTISDVPKMLELSKDDALSHQP